MIMSNKCFRGSEEQSRRKFERMVKLMRLFDSLAIERIYGTLNDETRTKLYLHLASQGPKHCFKLGILAAPGWRAGYTKPVPGSKRGKKAKPVSGPKRRKKK
jgi:hypothetical protein